MDQSQPDGLDRREEIVRLEARIEALAARIENCRKFILAARTAIALGGILLAAGIAGVIRFDPVLMTASITALLGGIVLLGSNSRTAQDAAAHLSAAEARRAELIGAMELRVVGD